jgi:hypothetical protein
MEISEITQGKKKKINEVNWGAIGGALAGIAKQSVTGQTPRAAPGQEAKVAKQLVQPITALQKESVKKTWQQMVSAEMARRKITDPQNIPAADLKRILSGYVTTYLLNNRIDVNALSGRHQNRVDQDLNQIVTQTQANDANALGQSLEKLVSDIQSATMNQAFSAGSRRPQLTPQATVMMQRMAPQIAMLQQSWPQGMTQMVSPTDNQAVNALLAGLGLLKTSSGPVSAAPAQTPPTTGTPE